MIKRSLSIAVFTAMSMISTMNTLRAEGKGKDYSSISHNCYLDISKGENRKVDIWLKGGGTNPDGEKLEVNSLYWSKDGKPWLPVMGEFHYQRFPHQHWEEQILKMKATGLSIISSYVIWREHENPEECWHWKGDNDLRRFIELCQKHGMYVWLRPGPYINAEAQHGGLPDWMNKGGKRSLAPWFIEKTTNYYAKVAEQVKGLWFKDGGPIIGLQVDNEYAHGNKKYLGKLYDISCEKGMIAPFNTVTNNSKHEYEKGNLIPLQGAYPYRGWGGSSPTTDYLFAHDAWNAMQNIGGLPYDGDKYPRGMCELGVACWQNHGRRFVVPVHDSVGHVQNVLGRGVNLLGYYMYQGGTQTEHMKGGGHPMTYDFQAPLGEYGQIRPRARAMMPLHHFVNDFGDKLAEMQPVHPANKVLDPRDTKGVRYIGRFKGDSGFVFMTNTQCYVDMKEHKNITVELKLSNGMMKFPQKPFNLKPNTCPIFPVNLDLNGTNLNYSTAQLMAKVQDKGIPYYFFVQCEGIEPEFSFSNAKKINTPFSKTRKGRQTIVNPEPGLSSAITLTGKNGNRAVIILLSEKQAQNSWRLKFRGKERLFLSECGLILNQQKLELISPNNEMKLSVFPELAEINDNKPMKREGIFNTFSFMTKTVKINADIEKKSNSEWSITKVRSSEKVNDIFMYVDYIGSMGKLDLDGTYYSDEFYNGKIWDIGLKRFNLGESPKFTVKATKWNNPIGIPADKQPKNAKEKAGEIRKITFRPEYKIVVK